jgi:hypothetical protein
MSEPHNGGFVLLYRKLLDNPIWTQLVPTVAKVAIYFLLRANYKPIQWYDGYAAVDIPAGSFITSLEKTAIACNVSIQQVRDAFIHLGRTRFATYRRTHHWTLVTVLNWSVYQAPAEDENTGENTQENTPENWQGTLNNKETNNNNTCASLDAHIGQLTSTHEPPFGTALEPLPEEPLSLEPVNRNLHDAAGAKSGRARLASQQEAWFRDFWSEYWHKISKKAAWEAFRKAVKTEGQFEVVMAAVRAQTPQMLQREPSKRPYASTWLNGKRWEDELQAPKPVQPVQYLTDEVIEERRRKKFEEAS